MTEIIARRQFALLYIWLDIAFPASAALSEKIHDDAGRAGHGRCVHAGGLRRFSPDMPFPQHLCRAQSFFGCFCGCP